ncbi:MAG: dipeptidase [Cyclobacteriaceae bacterium]|nr:dipeptidase [Cyclobacteriaceae bacterium]
MVKIFSVRHIPYIKLFLLLACTQPKENYLSIHNRLLTLDTHADTPLNFAQEGFDFANAHDPWKTGTQVDLPRMQAGGLDGIFFAVFLSQGPLDSGSIDLAHQKTLDYFSSIYQVVEQNKELVAVATAPDDLGKLNNQGKKAIYIGLENGYPIGYDLTRAWQYYNLGARYITLCHGTNNQICDSSTDPSGPLHNGLSDFGKELVAEMNRIGMMIDVSHISDSAFNDVLNVSKAPVMASHSSVRSLCDHPRNLTDDMIIRLAEKGGVIQINALSSYVKTPGPNLERDSAMAEIRSKYGSYDQMTPKKRDEFRKEYLVLKERFKDDLAAVSDFADHIDYVVDLVGIDYVGIGMDLDGGGGLKDCYDVSEMPEITRELLKRGYSEEDISKIWSENFMRVFREVDQYANQVP